MGRDRSNLFHLECRGRVQTVLRVGQGDDVKRERADSGGSRNHDHHLQIRVM